MTTKQYLGYKYKITTHPSTGGYYFEVWSPGADTRAPGLSWGPQQQTEDAAERVVMKWIEEQQPRRRKW
jgi:hypothetical protein